MANTIITKNSATASAVPTSGDLVQGELAVNVTDKRLFTEDSGGTVVEVGTNPSTMAVAGNATVGGTLGVTGLATLASSTLTANPTLTSGTANGVTYLNGSKVLTSGSALTFDGAGLGVGTGTIPAGRKLVIDSGNIRLSTDYQIEWGGSTVGLYGNGSTNSLSFFTNTSEQMRLTSTGLGIGTSSPATKLHVSGQSRVADSSNAANYMTFGVGANAPYGNASISTTTAGLTIVAEGAGNITFRNNGSEAMRIDTANNLGLGVTPSAWSGFKAFDIGTVGGLSCDNGGTFLTKNAYDNTGSGGWKYKTTAAASLYLQQAGGTHSWYTAPSGTAGNAISFTQAMTLDASGNLGIGTSSPGNLLTLNKASGNYGLSINATGYGTLADFGVVNAGTDNTTYVGSVSNNPFKIKAYNQYVATFDQSGNLGLGVTPSGWGGTYRALQVGLSTSLVGLTNDTKTHLSTNARFDGTNWLYMATSPASRYAQSDNIHQWYTAPSGTAGNPISFSQAMTLDASGNLGVGETSPDVRLSIKTSAGLIANMNSTNATGGYIRFQTSGVSYGDIGTAAQVFTSGSASDFAINARPSTNLIFGTSNTERARIDSSGNITSTTSEAYLYFTSNYTVGANTRASIRTVGAGGGSGYGGDLRISTRKPDNSWNTDAVVVDSSGNLLVGATSSDFTNSTGVRASANGFLTSTQSASTNANSTLNCYSTGAGANRFYVGWGGTVYATSTTIAAISDQRFKENIVDLDVGLDAVLALKPRKFDWKSGKGRDIKGDRGWIAQEFEQVFPDLIDTWQDPAPEGEEPYKAVRPDLIPVLVKAIQEQQAIIESLKARLDAANL